MLTRTFGAAVNGIEALKVVAEVNISQGLRVFIVGLPDAAVKESELRIESAIKESGWTWTQKKVVINLAPADIRKEGSSYDLTMAIGFLAATGQISDEHVEKYMLMGELSLDGTLKPIKGVLPIALCAKAEGFEGLIVPEENAREAAIVDGLKVYGAHTLRQVGDFLNNGNGLEQVDVNIRQEFENQINDIDFDYADVKGQETAKRAFEIAAAGGHNILLMGTPGSGKSLMSKCLPSILPPMTLEEALETTKIHSVAGKTAQRGSLITKRPFRSPHHTISDVALVGGGASPQPGEISLAHNGVLFLDELPEFKRSVLEVMRQPLEDRTISISRSKFAVDYPASFMLVASMNPCPCGYYGSKSRQCTCRPDQVQRYLGKISGPLLDRIDMHILVTPVAVDELTKARGKNEQTAAESSVEIRKRVIAARLIQTKRFAKLKNVHCNAQMTTRQLGKYCELDDMCRNVLKDAMVKMGLSARAYDRILRVSRTIADLAGRENIEFGDIAEAIQYRTFDRDSWGE